MAEQQQATEIPAATPPVTPPPEAPPAEVVRDPAVEQARQAVVPDFTNIDAEKPLSDEEVDALISHDPFKDGAPDFSRVPPAQAPPETPPVAAPGLETPPVAVVPPALQAAPAPAPVPAPQQDPQMAALLQQNALLQQQITAMQQAVQPQGPGVPTATAAAMPGQPAVQPEQVPAYSYEMPPQIVQGLFGEDGDMGTRSRALSALVQGLGKTIHQEMRQEMQTRMQTQLPEQVSQHVQSAVSRENERARIFDDFYQTYPQFNQPAYQPIVAQAAQLVQQEIGATAWTPYMREQVAHKTALLLGGQQQQAAPPQQYIQPQVQPQYVQQPLVQQVTQQGLPVVPPQYAPVLPPTQGLPAGPPMQFAPGANPIGISSPEANGGINSPTDIYQVMGI